MTYCYGQACRTAAALTGSGCWLPVPRCCSTPTDWSSGAGRTPAWPSTAPPRSWPPRPPTSRFSTCSRRSSARSRVLPRATTSSCSPFRSRPGRWCPRSWRNLRRHGRRVLLGEGGDRIVLDRGPELIVKRHVRQDIFAYGPRGRDHEGRGIGGQAAEVPDERHDVGVGEVTVHGHHAGDRVEHVNHRDGIGEQVVIGDLGDDRADEEIG